MFELQEYQTKFYCEICESTVEKSSLAGIEIEYSTAKPIKTCCHCGPVDFEVMQLCREAVIGSRTN